MRLRNIDIPSLSAKKSILLLGPRQTGKSTLLKKNFSGALFIDLLESETFREFSTYPERLREIVSEKRKLIIVDEIQRVTQLLNKVHLLIEKYKKNRFILTGSSARTLRKGSSNLLAGRAWTMHLFPLTTKEVGPFFKEKDILRLLNVGGLPAIYDSSEAKRDLAAYVGTYLKEEIRAESLVRNLERFSRF